MLLLAAGGTGWYLINDLEGDIATSKALPSSTPRSVDGSTNILLMGLDSRKDQNGKDLPPSVLKALHAGNGTIGGYNTNTLILLHVPKDGSRATGISVPRDDYVDRPGFGPGKIKEAYGLAKDREETRLRSRGVTDELVLEREGREAGRRAEIETVQKFLKVPIDHFAEVNLAGFYHLAGALDGVEVCLKKPARDSYSGADFPAGHQTLDGAQALAFVRQRHGLANGDLDRTRRQQAFLASAAHKLRGQGVFGTMSRLSRLVDVAKKDLVVDEGWDLLSFVREASALSGGNMQFHTLPIAGFATRNGQSVNLVDQDDVRVFVQQALTRPAATSGRGPAAPAPAPAVDVLNGTGKEGLARQTIDALVAKGYRKGSAGNTAIAKETSVHYGAGARREAERVAQLLNGVPVESDDQLAHGRLSVVLGGDFTVPTPLRPSPKQPLPQGISAKGIPCVD
ncbi:LCP family protein [Streptomyces sp. NPDC008343]|uniref:LCP family protein n=1 Tax=Streptomyces sp. NPDC008343 TaxID=3364828 RepID=UPI0036F10E7B